MCDFHPHSSDVVFVRYSGEISHLVDRFSKDGFMVKVYEKHPDKKDAPYTVPINKGNEASGYLKYIIDHYHSLPDHVVFMHDHEFAWHQKGSIYDLVSQHVGKKIRYQSLNCFTWNNETIEWIPGLLEWYDEFFMPEMGNIHKFGDFMTGHKGCAQFIVHKSLIQKRSLTFYTRLYAWLMTTELTDYYSGRHLEYTWHLMWGQVSQWNLYYQKLHNLWCRLRGKSVTYNHLLKCIENHPVKKPKKAEALPT